MPLWHRYWRPFRAELWVPISFRAALFLLVVALHTPRLAVSGWATIWASIRFLEQAFLPFYPEWVFNFSAVKGKYAKTRRLAIGIIFVYMIPGYAPNLMSYLFGSILTVSSSEIWLMLALAIVIILFFTFFYRTILYISFDEDFARTSNLPVNLFNYLLMILISLTIVLNIRVVGIILILSLLTIPQATANVLTREFGRMMVYSVGFAFLASFIGLLISYFADIPSGATIIFTQVILFGLVKLIKMLSTSRK